MSDSLQPHRMQHTRLHCPSLSSRVCWFMSIQSPMLSNYLILCHPLLLLPSIFLSIRVFSNEMAVCIRWPKYWSFSFSISPSNEYLALISFSIDWFDLLAVQETLKSLLQHHGLKAWIFRHSAFFMVQLSHCTCSSLNSPHPVLCLSQPKAFIPGQEGGWHQAHLWAFI